MFAADVHVLVLNRGGGSLFRNCCCFKFQQRVGIELSSCCTSAPSAVKANLMLPET